MWITKSPLQIATRVRRTVRSALPAWALRYATRSQKLLRKTLRKSLPALLPGIHQVSNQTGFDRHPRIFAAAASVARDARRILSFGCSTGEECVTLKMYFPNAEIIGADINPLNLWKARHRYGSDGIRFVHAGKRSLTSQGLFDVIFCLMVLVDTRLEDEPSIRDSYPFERFEERVSLLNSLLSPGGLLVVYRTMYRFCDTLVAQDYEVVPMVPPIEKNPTFARDGRNNGVQYLDVLFRKKVAEPSNGTPSSDRGWCA
jgi:hypothetical protein